MGATHDSQCDKRDKNQSLKSNHRPNKAPVAMQVLEGKRCRELYQGSTDHWQRAQEPSSYFSVPQGKSKGRKIGLAGAHHESVGRTVDGTDMKLLAGLQMGDASAGRS
jgi:hypothetical protein